MRAGIEVSIVLAYSIYQEFDVTTTNSRNFKSKQRQDTLEMAYDENIWMVNQRTIDVNIYFFFF